MNKKGFTLVELLGVIIILSLLMLIVLPRLVNSIKSSSDKVDDLTLKLIYNATDLYLDENTNNYPKVEGVKYCITVSSLVDSNYLKGPVKLSNSDIDISGTKSVQVIYNNGYKYELVNNEDCKLQKTYEAGEIVYFNVTTGEACKESEAQKLGNSGCLKFYILSDKPGKLDLLPNHNTTESIAWNSTGSNLNGPKEILNQLKEDTKDWKGVLSLENYSYSGYMDCSLLPEGCVVGPFNYKIDYSTFNARLVTYEELKNLGTEKTTEEGITYLELPLWLVIDGDSDLSNENLNYTYWTATASNINPLLAQYIDFAELEGSSEAIAITSPFDIDRANYHGVRPVISVLKSKFE